MSTAIQWTDETWNPVVGCTKVSQGCKNCYAKQIHDNRHKAFLAGKKVAPQYSQPFEHVQLMPERLLQPLTWRKPRRVFVNSVSDLFHEDVPDEFLDQVFAAMALAQRHTFQVLTKRPERMRAYLTSCAFPRNVGISVSPIMDGLRGQAESDAIAAVTDLMLWFEDPHAEVGDHSFGMKLKEPALPNVWLGVSVERQQEADERIPLLLQTPAAVRFLSCEPLLGPVDILESIRVLHRQTGDFHPVFDRRGGIDWVIVGGESGTKARPCDVTWVHKIARQCEANRVPYFVKQMGRWITGDHSGFTVDRWLLDDGRAFVPPMIRSVFNAPLHDRPEHAIAFGLCHNKGGNPGEWPENLRVREWPAEVAA